MGVKHTVLPDGQPPTVAFAMLVQLRGLNVIQLWWAPCRYFVVAVVDVVVAFVSSEYSYAADRHCAATCRCYAAARPARLQLPHQAISKPKAFPSSF